RADREHLAIDEHHVEAQQVAQRSESPRRERREGDRLARVVARLVDEPEELGREQRAQGHVDTDRLEGRHELRDAEPAAGAFLLNWRQRQHANRFPTCGHARLSSDARARTAAARSTASAAEATTIGTIA